MGKPNKTSGVHDRSERKALTITCTKVMDKPYTQDHDITFHCVESEWQDRAHAFTFSLSSKCVFPIKIPMATCWWPTFWKHPVLLFPYVT